MQMHRQQRAGRARHARNTHAHIHIRIRKHTPLRSQSLRVINSRRHNDVCICMLFIGYGVWGTTAGMPDNTTHSHCTAYGRTLEPNQQCSHGDENPGEKFGRRRRHRKRCESEEYEMGDPGAISPRWPIMGSTERSEFIWEWMQSGARI